MGLPPPSPPRCLPFVSLSSTTLPLLSFSGFLPPLSSDLCREWDRRFGRTWAGGRAGSSFAPGTLALKYKNVKYKNTIVPPHGREPPDRAVPCPGEQDRHAGGGQRRRIAVSQRERPRG